MTRMTGQGGDMDTTAGQFPANGQAPMPCRPGACQTGSPLSSRRSGKAGSGKPGPSGRKSSFRFSGRFLELSGVTSRPSITVAVAAQADSAHVAAVSELQISVPKRLVRAAVRRNTVKRVLREAWRHGPDVLHQSGRVWRFRLKVHPDGNLAAKSQHARAQLRFQRAEQSNMSVLAFRSVKRQLRDEADQLLAQAVRHLLGSRAPVRGVAIGADS